MLLRRTYLTIVHANLVLLASMLLILVGSFVMADWPTYWVLSIREVLFILLPACVVVLALKRPMTEKAHVLRLRWPGGRIAAASALIGAGGWLIDSWLGVVFTEWLGYVTPLPPDFFPTAPGRALVLLVVLSILAPICEEILFRGVIQRGYEELSPRAGILAGSALFVLFHQSLPQGLALMPLAYLLGYMVWRSDSLFPGIIAHAANNALAGVLIIVATADPEVVPDALLSAWVGTLPGAGMGIALVALGLWGFRRWVPRSLATAATEPGRPKMGIGLLLARFWPLLLVLPIATFSIGLEATLGWFPEALALGQQVRWSSAPWDRPHTWTYEVRKVIAAAEEPVGQVQCSLVLEDTAYLLACNRQQSAHEADAGKGMYDGGDVDEQWTARWHRPSLRLSFVERRVQIITTNEEAASRESSVAPGVYAVDVTTRRTDSGRRGAPQGTSFSLEPSSSPLWPGRVQEPTVLESSEWPWRLSALPFSGFYSAQATMIDPYALSEEAGDSGPAAEATHVVVYGAEPVKTPAGTHIAWHVRVGKDWTAWYDVDRPHTLVALDNGTETWVLTSID